MDQAASKTIRLVGTLSDAISMAYKSCVAIFLTTGLFDPSLKTKSHCLAGLSCRVATATISGGCLRSFYDWPAFVRETLAPCNKLSRVVLN